MDEFRSLPITRTHYELVIPANAGTQLSPSSLLQRYGEGWAPAFAGVTKSGGADRQRD
jgi:hypothetical protein